MPVTPEQAAQFVNQGYIQVPGTVPDVKVRKALQAIKHPIGTVGKIGADAAALRKDRFCCELRTSKLLLELLHGTRVRKLAEGLLGRDRAQLLQEMQVDPIFPLSTGAESPALSGHLDAAGAGTNGTAVGSYVRHFTLMVVICLVDVPGPLHGNFTVWSGSHVETRDFFHQHGHEILAQEGPAIPLTGAHLRIAGQAGDVILAHHLLQHVGGPNTSPRVHHAVIGRMAHVDVARLGYGGFTEMWAEVPRNLAAHCIQVDSVAVGRISRPASMGTVPVGMILQVLLATSMSAARQASFRQRILYRHRMGFSQRTAGHLHG